MIRHRPITARQRMLLRLLPATTAQLADIGVVECASRNSALNSVRCSLEGMEERGLVRACHLERARMLYGAAWRAARALGWLRLITYTLPSEGGASLRAAGWRLIGEAGGGAWSRASRPRVDKHPTQVKFRWEVRA